MVNTKKKQQEETFAISNDSNIKIAHYIVVKRQIVSLFALTLLAMTFSSCYVHGGEGYGHRNQSGYRHNSHGTHQVNSNRHSDIGQKEGIRRDEGERHER